VNFEVAVFSEDSGVNQLAFGDILAAAAVLFDELGVRKCALRVLVQCSHIRVSRSGVQVEVVLLDVLAVIALRASQTEQALFQDAIVLVPQRERETQSAVVIADTQQPVFAPTVGA